jgi:hypothetical protein
MAFSRRRFVEISLRAAVALLAVALCRAAVAQSSGPLALKYCGKVRLDASEDSIADQNGVRFTITGLSGITFLGASNYVAVMDNSNHLVAFALAFDQQGHITAHKVTGGYSLDTSRDYEGIAYTNRQRNSVFISEEAPAGASPKIYEYALGGTAKLLQTIEMPPVFKTQVFNRGLESLTRRADGLEMWTANEEALTADGPVSTQTAGTVVRLVRLAVKGDTIMPDREYAYVTEPIHGAIGKALMSGLSDLVVLADGTLITLERSAVEGLPPLETRIFQVDFAGATDVSKGELANGLKDKTYTPVKKSLLFDANASGNSIGENLEGLCLGPELSKNHWVLVGVVDNGDPVSKNTLVSFELTVGEPK